EPGDAGRDRGHLDGRLHLAAEGMAADPAPRPEPRPGARAGPLRRLTRMEDALPQGRPALGAKPGHETTEIRVRGLVIFSIALVGVIAAAQVILGLWMRDFARKEERIDALYPARIAIEVDQFPNPRLQQNPRSDLDEMKAE